MDTANFENLTRKLGTHTNRRSALRSLVAGAIALVGGSAVLSEAEGKRRKKKKSKKGGLTTPNPSSPPSSPTPPPPPPPVNVCEGKNWCVDRTQTCGPAGGYGKCLVEATGDNICAEILFQVASCSDCDAPNCTNCRCVLAAGGGDRCNNGASGYDFICVREV